MPIPFLQEVAKKLYKQHGKNIDKLYIILPTRRTCIYFRNYLLNIIKEPILSPEILSIDDFIVKIGQLHISDNITMLMNLFHCFRKYDKNKKHSLDSFFPLGMAILEDFNLIEYNLNSTQAKKLFQSLEEIKAIERWAEELNDKISPEKYASIQEYFIFWENLTQTYHDFRSLTLAQENVYSGLAYRKVFEHLDDLLKKKHIQHIVFAGFSQLNKIEEEIIKTLWEKGKADIFWDVDSYYFEDKDHEAGYYFRTYIKWITQEQMNVHRYIETEKKTVKIYQVTSKILQVKLVGDLLEKELQVIKKKYSHSDDFKENYKQTAILLPEENLLLPLLYSLPSKITFSDGKKADFTDYLNVTMDLGIQYTPLFELIKTIFLFQENLREDEEKGIFTYYKYLIKLLHHPYISGILADIIEEIQQDLQIHKSIYLFIDTYTNKFSKNYLWKILTRKWKKSYQDAILYICDILEFLDKNFQNKKLKLECEFIYELYTVLKKLKNSFQQNKETISMKTFKLFLFEVIRHVSVSFTGEPISHFQIMGIFKSRALDFDKVIILSCNEEILPQGKNLNSIIPFGIRIHHSLPTYREYNSASAYTFYRLFHRAKEIILIYTDPSTILQGYEKSRFLLQIENELAKLPNINLEYSHVELDLPKPSKISPEIPKNESLINLIKEKLKKGISPTSISLYIKSPLKFLYSKIFDLKESFELNETFDQRTFGIVIHETLQKLFKPYQGSIISVSIIDNFLNRKNYIRNKIIDSIRERFGKIILHKGKNYILLNVAVQLIEKFLNKQKNILPFYLLVMEDFLNHTIKIPLKNGEIISFKIFGQADRIDIRENQIQVIDYKTGSYLSKELKASNWQDLIRDTEKEKIVQLLSYKYLLLKAFKTGKINHLLPRNFDDSSCCINSGFFFFRKMSDDFIPYCLEDEPKETEDFINYVENIFSIFVNDLLDESKYFKDEQADFEKLISQRNTDHDI